MSPDGGFETLRALAAADSSVRALPTADRSVLAARWAGRAANEQATSGAFSEVRRALVECEAPPELVDGASRAVDDEGRHAGICSLIAEHYAGQAVPLPPPPAPRRAKFSGCSPRESSFLYVVLHTSISESIAASYLTACATAATTELTREAVRLFLRDEVRHARLGFTFLALGSASDRRLTGDALLSLVGTALDAWLDRTSYPEHVPPGHGCVGHDQVRAAVVSALDELVLPGFVALGIETAGARALLERSLISDGETGYR